MNPVWLFAAVSWALAACTDRKLENHQPLASPAAPSAPVQRPSEEKSLEALAGVSSVPPSPPRPTPSATGAIPSPVPAKPVQNFAAPPANQGPQFRSAKEILEYAKSRPVNSKTLAPPPVPSGFKPRTFKNSDEALQFFRAQSAAMGLPPLKAPLPPALTAEEARKKGEELMKADLEKLKLQK